jgi:hypothetical protein
MILRLTRIPACALARARSVLYVIAVSLICGASLLLNGCADVKIPTQWKVWPGKVTAPRDLPTPSLPAPPSTGKVPALQRTLPPALPSSPFTYGLPELASPTGLVAAPFHKINIALLVPLSGPSANIGHALLDAAQLALFDVADDRINLLPKDTFGTPEGAARAAEEALSDGAELILGPLFSQSVAAAAPIARRGGINIIAFSTDRKVAASGVFLFGFLPHEQVERVVDHAIGQGLTRFAALLPQNPYGNTILEALMTATWTRGAEIVQVETYPDTRNNPHEAVKRLADYDNRREALLEERERIEEEYDEDEAKPLLEALEGLETIGELEYDAIIIPEGGDRLRSVALLLPYYDIDPAKIRFMGTGLWDDENIGREPALVGGWFAAVPPELSHAFTERFATVFGTRPPRIASIAYDSLALAALLAEAQPDLANPSFGGPSLGSQPVDYKRQSGSRFSADRITAATGFNGANGLFRLRPGGLTERGLAVVEVGRNGTKVIAPPPTSFDTQTIHRVERISVPEMDPSPYPLSPSDTPHAFPYRSEVAPIDGP